MTKSQIEKWILHLKKDMMNNPQYRGYSEQEIDEMIMDGMFYGFQQGELSRQDLAYIAEILGLQISEEFMNDPHPDPISLKKKR